MDEKVRIALAAYGEMRRAALADSPLSGMAQWVSSGSPPPAAELRAVGLDGCSESRNEAEGKRSFNLRLARKAFVAEWGFSIPCNEALAALKRLGSIVEVGAGTGYWTAMLQAAGVDAVATDKTSQGDLGYGFEAGRYCEVEELSAEVAVARYPDRAVFCSWPSEGELWSLATARLLDPGRCFALVGGSTTGTPELTAYLKANFDLIEEVDLPRFPGCDDRLTVHRRR